jgi:hypothetical protein
VSKAVSSVERTQSVVPLLEPAFVEKLQHHDFASSSIEKKKATELPFSPSKPDLEKPIWRLLRTVTAIETLSDSFMELGQVSVEMYMARMQTLSKQEMEKIQEALQHAENAGFWQFLQEIASLILSVTSCIFGFNLNSSGQNALLGGVLIASGLLSIANFAFKETGVWDSVASLMAKENEELRKELSRVLPSVIGLTTALISLGGSTYAAAFTSLDTGQKVLKIGETAAATATNLAAMGQSTHEGRKHFAESEFMRTKVEGQLVLVVLQKTMRQMQELCENQAELTEKASNVVRAAERSIQIIHHSV